MYAGAGGNVRDVVVEGRVVMRDREILTADEAEVLSLAAEAASQLVG